MPNAYIYIYIYIYIYKVLDVELTCRHFLACVVCRTLQEYTGPPVHPTESSTTTVSEGCTFRGGEMYRIPHMETFTGQWSDYNGGVFWDGGWVGVVWVWSRILITWRIELVYCSHFS